MIHLSASIDSAISMLACSKLGIHFSVIFQELEEEAISKRIKIFKPNIFLTRSKKLSKKKKNRLTKFIHLNIQNMKTNKKLIIKENLKNENFKSNQDFFTPLLVLQESPKV